MDRGTDAKKLLLGVDVPLKLGYVGVRNRSQQDIKDKVKVKQAIEAELDFFSKHSVYSTMDSRYLGTKALIKKLTDVLFHHIRLHLPKIIKEIDEKVKDCEERLKELGKLLGLTPRNHAPN